MRATQNRIIRNGRESIRPSPMGQARRRRVRSGRALPSLPSPRSHELVSLLQDAYEPRADIIMMFSLTYIKLNFHNKKIIKNQHLAVKAPNDYSHSPPLNSLPHSHTIFHLFSSNFHTNFFEISSIFIHFIKKKISDPIENFVKKYFGGNCGGAIPQFGRNNSIHWG